MNIQDSQERMLVAGGLFVLAGSLGALGTVLSAMGIDHMAFAANLCGPLAGHCLVCFAAAGTVAASFAAGIAAVSLFRPARRIKVPGVKVRSA